MSLTSLKEVYVEQLKDMYSAEKQMVGALPKMVEAASNSELKAAFQNHLAQTKLHMEKVRSILDHLDENPTSTKCKAMAGLIDEGNKIAKEKGDPNARNAALILVAQKVEHYEIASYGGLAAFAKTLGYKQAARELQAILDEEYSADQTLNNIASGVHKNIMINVAAKT